MTERKLPNEDHVGRFCGGSKIDEDGEATAAAFRLRAGETYLSVNWLEFLADFDSSKDSLESLREVYRSKFNKVGATARVARLNVGETIAFVKSESIDFTELQFSHEPEEKDPSHSGIYGIPEEQEIVSELIAQMVIDTHPAK